MNRRDFMKTTVLASAATAMAGRRATAATAPSDRLRVGFIGCGARAQQLMQAVVAMSDVETVALCDAYTGRLDRARARTGGKATVYKDYRELLASPSVDAVFIATPDHWHKTMAIDAVAAGKDVYLEKPMSFAMSDGPAIVEAVSRSNRILQVGSQGVSSPEIEKARELIKAGTLGQVTMVRAAYNRNGDSGAWLYPIPPDANPAHRQLGAVSGTRAEAAVRSSNRFFRWRCYWDYSGGIATDLFVHLVSWYHHALDLKAPGTVMAAGANYRYKATHEVPDTVNALLMYPEGVTASLTCTFNNAEGTASGLEILGHEGKPRPARWRADLHARVGTRRQSLGGGVLGRGGRACVLRRSESAGRRVAVAEAGHLRPAGESWRSEGRDDDFTHIANFVSSVKTRTQPVEDAAFGHRAAACAHMVNQSIREKRIVEWQS